MTSDPPDQRPHRRTIVVLRRLLRARLEFEQDVMVALAYRDVEKPVVAQRRIREDTDRPAVVAEELHPRAHVVDGLGREDAGQPRADDAPSVEAEQGRAVLRGVGHHPVRGKRDETPEILHASRDVDRLAVAIGQVDLVVGLNGIGFRH
jgi:hypothetical protein